MESTDRWLPQRSCTPLAPGEVHLWRTTLETDETTRASLYATLDDAEIARAARLQLPGARDRFVVGRGVQRALLGGYLGVAPERLQMQAGPHGKPMLGGNAGWLHFNASNAGALCVFAFSSGREIGVDIEERRPIDDVETLASRFFSVRESASLLRLPAHDRSDAFLSCWTRKEAYVKAIGDGLSMSLAAFDVSVEPGQSPRIERIGDEPEAHHRWALLDFSPGPGYVGALAVPGARPVLRYFSWFPPFLAT